MSAPSDRIEILSAPPGVSLWDACLARFAAMLSGRLWDPPLWVLPDARHREAAELALLRALERPAIPLQALGTLASLAAGLRPDDPPPQVVRPTAAALILNRLLAQSAPESYRASCARPGFAPFFWTSLLEAESRGWFPAGRLPSVEGPPPPRDFVSLQARFHRALEERGQCTPGEYLRRAVVLLGVEDVPVRLPREILIGPLQQVSALEREFIAAVARRMPRVILAPAAGVSAAVLLPPGFLPEAPPGPPPDPAVPPDRVLFLRPASPEAELDAAFAAIAGWAARGQFRYGEIRLYHPAAEDELPRLLHAAARYQVPVRPAFGRPLAQFPGVVLLRKLLALFQSGWSRADVLDLLRSRALALPWKEAADMIRRVLAEPDRRTHPPGRGWIEQAEESGWRETAQALTQLQALDLRGPMDGPAFNRWVRTLADGLLARPAEPSGELADPALAAEERAAWECLGSALEEMAPCFPEAVDRSVLVSELDRAVGQAAYLPRDLRRDAVEICPAARPDHLPVPVALWLSLHSRFPAAGRVNPFLSGDPPLEYAARLRLFRQQTANAGQLLALSCPRFDDGGDELALSPFLNAFPGLAGESGARQRGADLLARAGSWRPFAEGGLKNLTRDPAGDSSGRVTRDHGLRIMRSLGGWWSPSRLESAIQCRFLHFAGFVLKLSPLADAMVEPVSPLLLGSVAHQALEEYLRRKLRGEPADPAALARDFFRRATERFDPHPEIDRAEAELVRSLAQAAELGWDRLAAGFSPRLDGEDRAALELIFGEHRALPGLDFGFGGFTAMLGGKIDRLDLGPEGRALVLEYKYRKAENESAREFFAAVRTGLQPQLPLYWMAAQRLLNLRPVALLQMYLRSGVIRGLKTAEAPADLEGREELEMEELSAEDLEAMLHATRTMLETKARAVMRGDVAPQPLDFAACGPGACDYADLCRYRERR
ncbi:MAG: PD-(D/E)XK nuclease family protein [Candidatus Zixiibacteriota bacterium]|nr:MAG: PD-(D/E)XK nuclease family protein [candidate division Zixibacteria bacterium]